MVLLLLIDFKEFQAAKKKAKQNKKTNKIWINQGSEFYNCFSKKLLKGNDIEMNSIHNEGKSVIAERFIRT